MKWVDPIVEEVRRAGEAYAAQFDYDLKRMFEDLQRREQEHPERLAKIEPRKPKPVVHPDAHAPVYDELVDFIARGSTPEEVIRFRPSAETKQRVADLMRREKESQLTAGEITELNRYLEIEHILCRAKAKARLLLAEKV